MERGDAHASGALSKAFLVFFLNAVSSNKNSNPNQLIIKKHDRPKQSHGTKRQMGIDRRSLRRGRRRGIHRVWNPTKVIIFSNQGMERFMEESRQNLDVSDRAGYSSDGTQSDPIPVGLWMRDSSYSDGYAMIAVPISEAYLNSNLPAEIKTNEYAYALASAYFGVCFDSHHYKPAFPEHFSRTVSFLRDPTVV